jgi:hypothetical protein
VELMSFLRKCALVGKLNDDVLGLLRTLSLDLLSG